MVSLNFFKLFKRKKEPRNIPINSQDSGTKLGEDAAANVGKVNKISKKEKAAKLQVGESSGVEKVNLKEKNEDSRQLHEQLSGKLKKEHKEVDVVEPVDVEQQGHSKVVESKPVLNEVNFPDGTSVTEEIKEAESTPVFEENVKAPVTNDRANQSEIALKETEKPEIIPVAIDQSNATEDAEIIEQEVSNENLESKGKATQQVEIPDKSEKSLEPVETNEIFEIPAETKEYKVETNQYIAPTEATEIPEIPEIPAKNKEDKVETDKSPAPVEKTENVEIPAETKEDKVKTDNSFASVETTEHAKITLETDESLAPAEKTENVEIPTETKEDKAEQDESLELVDQTDALFKEFLKNAQNNVFPNEQSKEIFKSYNDGEIDEAAAIILLQNFENKAKPKSNNTNSKKNRKNNNKKKGKKGKKK